MKLMSVGNNLNFRANGSENASSGVMSSSLMTTASNAAVGAGVGAAVGAVRCLMPVSKSAISEKEVSSLSSKLRTVINNNQWLGFINNVSEMADDVFSSQSEGLAQAVGISVKGKGLFDKLFKKEVVTETITKSQILDAAKAKLIGEGCEIVSEDAIKELGTSFTKKSSDLVEYAKTFVKENPKDELVKLAKTAAKKVRNAGVMKSSIRFCIMTAMILGIFNTLKSVKKSDK